MIGKILRIELLIFFLFTITSFVAFYYGDSLPDNYLAISSKQESVNFLTYYLASFVSFVGYYTGPWIFFQFIILAITHAFLFSKRNFILDSVTTFFLVAALVPSFYLLAPEFLGQGLVSFLKESGLGYEYFALIAICSFGIYLTLIFRRSFLIVVWKSFKYILWSVRSSPRLLKFVFRLNPSEIGSELKVSMRTKLWIKGFLRGKVKTVDTNISSSPEVTSIPVKETKVENEIVVDAENVAVSNVDNVEEVAPPAVVKRVKSDKIVCKPNVEFTSEELINCVSCNKHNKSVIAPDNQYFKDIIDRIDEKLEQFRIDGEILNILKGPVVDTFELELGPGVKVSKLNSIVDDLSLALYGAPIRIVYPMRGRTTVGIEVPRNPREIIYLDDVLRDKEFINCNKRLPIAMGKNAFGEIVVEDLASMPHMLVAGSTGAGKSVFINSLLVSLLVKRSPREMKLILIDPKQLELTLYSKLPHLIMPVVTSAKEASLAFLWAVQEMEKRYTILRELGVRNIIGFNDKLKSATPVMLTKIHGLYPEGEADNYYLPYLVLIVDEFADLMHTKAGKDIEANVCRLAQKARAAGIHIILATQRPSVDVVTGLIKNNFPSRVSFRVTTSIDSRTILNKIGAEKLLGRGDMLFRSEVDINRVHSPYVDENEIEVLTNKLAIIPATFRDDAIDFLNSESEHDSARDEYTYASHISNGQIGGKEKDELYDEAVKIVAEHRSASASMLQRRLNIGYNRAANLVDAMESDGIVGPAQGAKPRKVLVAAD